MVESKRAMQAAGGRHGEAAALHRPELDPAGLRVERIAAAAVGDHLAAWTALCERALEGNIFLEPGFALPLFRHVRPAGRSDILVVWADDGPGRSERMVGLLPVRCPRFARGGLAIGLRDEMVASGTPLLDRERAPAAFAAMLDWLAHLSSRPAALLLTGVPADGAFMREVAGTLDPARPRAVVASHRRAVLRRVGGGDNVLSLASAKTRKERKRQRRRLAEQGERAYVSARPPAAVARAIECFLSLERKGWKGQRGTALAADASLAAFTRAMAGAMGREGKCRIDALQIDGQPVAMGIVLTSGGCAHFWKTAFDEDLATLSPGVQFAIDLAEAQLADGDVDLTDSCAIPDHPMIDKLWPDRMPIVDLAIGVHGRGTLFFALRIRAERLRRSARAWVKAKVLSLPAAMRHRRGR